MTLHPPRNPPFAGKSITPRRSTLADREGNSAWQWPCGLMDKALVFGTKDCRFESCQGHFLLNAPCAGTPVACHSMIAIAPFDQCARPHHQQPCCHSSCDAKGMTAVGFEPTPFRTGALSQRLRPLGQTVSGLHLLVHIAVPSDHRMHSVRRAEHKLRIACNSCFHVGRACA